MKESINGNSKMSAFDVYGILDQHGVEFEIVEIFDGVRIIRIEVLTYAEEDGDDQL